MMSTRLKKKGADWVDRDIEGAKAVGMTTVLAKYGQVIGKKKGADWEIGGIKGLLHIKPLMD